jgi:hypothetical protein
VTYRTVGKFSEHYDRTRFTVESLERVFFGNEQITGRGTMTEKRREDGKSRAWFRSSRFFQEEGKWGFDTREGTMEGPFPELVDAEKRLEEYVKIMNSGFMPEDSELDMEPR